MKKVVMEPGPRWNSEEGYYRHLEKGYDDLAPAYDEEIGSNPIGNRMREVFREALLDVLGRGGLVYEIGCGTGIDALWLAHLGFEVVATDISQGMLNRLQAKAKTEGLSERIRCVKMAAGEIGALREDYGEEAFDGGFCHAGALNMEPELQRVPGQIWMLLKQGGPFVCSVLNKISLFELLFYPIVLRPRKGFRRLGNVIPIPISRKEPLNRFVIPARFYTPRDIVRLFGDGFAVESIQGLQIFLPPANLSDYYVVTKPLFAALEFLEDRLSRVRPVNSWGHHTILTFRRK